MCKLLTLFTLMLALSFSSCQNKQQTTQKEGTEKSCCSSHTETTETEVFSPEKLMAEGASLVDKMVNIKGTVSHVCKHAGKKCFLEGEDPEVSLQVMAGGDIAAFDKELVGTEIVVKGTVKERRITKDQIAEQEQALKETIEKTDDKEKCGHCSNSLETLAKMKQWMADNSKDYYPIYFVEGSSYEAVK